MTDPMDVVREALRYAGHADKCRSHDDGPETCDCGSDAAVRGARAALERYEKTVMAYRRYAVDEIAKAEARGIEMAIEIVKGARYLSADAAIGLVRDLRALLPAPAAAPTATNVENR